MAAAAASSAPTSITMSTEEGNIVLNLRYDSAPTTALADRTRMMPVPPTRIESVMALLMTGSTPSTHPATGPAERSPCSGSLLAISAAVSD